MNIEVHIYFWISAFFSAEKYPELELLDCMVVLILVFLRKCHTAFHRNCTNLHPHRKCTWVFYSPHPHQDFFVVFLIIDILRSVRWYLNVVLIVFPWWLVMLSIFSCVCWSSVCLLWRKSLFRSSAHFSVGLFFFFFFFDIESCEFFISFEY